LTPASVAKLQTFSLLAEQSAKQITQSREEWTSFLETSSRLYKYPFNEQLLIFAQRPDAKACAPLEIWNNPMNRWIKRGSKGIALIDNTGEKPRLKYVFDMTDTSESWREAAQGSRANRPIMWALREEHEALVFKALADAYSTSEQSDLGDALFGIAGRLASEYFEANKQDIYFSIEDSFLEGLDDFNIELAYTNALTISTAYSLMTRCGIDPWAYLENEDFMPVFDFNTPDAVNALGTGVSEISEQVLREIEVTIKNYERQRTAERGDAHGKLNIFRERGLSDSQLSTDRTGKRADRQVRADEASLPQETSNNLVQFDGDEREAIFASAGNQQDSGGEIGTVDVGTGTEEPATQQGEQSDGVDAAHEHIEAPSGRIDIGGADLQLTPYPSMDDAALNDLLANSKLEIFDVDNILRAANNQKNGEQRIYLQYAHDMPPEDISAFLKNEYKTGGRGLQIGAKEVSVWWDKDGLLIGVGKTALQSNDRLFMSWAQVESRVRDLVQSGNYIAPEHAAQATENEHMRLAEKLVFIYRDDMRDFCETPAQWKENGDFHPEIDITVAALLASPETRDALISTLHTDNVILKENSNERQRRYYSIDNLLVELQVLQRPIVSLEQNELPALGFPFITDDEVDAYLNKGSSMSDGKNHIIQHFLNKHTLKESADFLKKHYGWSGSTHALSGADNSYVQASGKGLSLERGSIVNPYAKVEMKWPAVAKRIDTLINEGRYFTQANINDFQNRFTKNTVASAINSFYYNISDEMMPPDEQKPFTVNYDYSATTREITPQLDNPDRVREICSVMEAVYPLLDESIRNYEEKANYLKMVQAYRDGTLDLIPLLSTVPVPETIMSTADTASSMPTPANEQLQFSFFPTEQAQREIVAVAEGLNPSAFSITDEEIDALLVDALESPEIKQRISSQFEANPRSREATNTLKEIYSNVAFTMPRTDGEGGYLGVLGDVNGITLSKGTALSSPLAERQPVDAVTLAWPKVQRRIAQLVEAGVFIDTDSHLEAYELGYQYIGETILVRNVKDAGPDDLPPIVARIAPDGIVAYLDENIPSALKHKIERSAVHDFETYKAEADARWERLHDRLKDTDGLDSQEIQEPHTAQNRTNFRITDENLGHGGAKAKYQMNADAIRTLKHIESENRLATSDEQEILSRYVGWGGIPQAFDGERTGWTNEYAELRGLLTEDEYNLARASTLNAHYTSPTIIKAIYDAIEGMGFKSGNILEPACGIGNFFGLLPESMSQSKLYGVELDSITGRIAKQLYQNADIRITGFEKTETPDALFDLAIGNVPFGNYKVADKRYDKNNFAIHDYFFGKALDQVRSGGVIAFITSSGTLDKANPNVRKYIAQRAELLGAIRLPNNAFKANAGTDVSTDIIFLQKRDRLMDIQPDWVHLGQTEDGVPVNSYFAENPEMILGKMVFDVSMYGKANDTACHPLPDANLATQLQEAVRNIHGQISDIEHDDTLELEDTSIPADPYVRNYSYTLVDDAVYYREASRMYPADLPTATLDRVKGMVQIRDCVHSLIKYQLDEYDDSAIAEKQFELNQLYGTFTKKHGLINTSANGKAFSADSAYYLLCSLEILDENGALARKADMFTKRTIKQNTIITSVDTAGEALVVSISERACVDLPYMQSLTGFSEDRLVADLQGSIYRNTVAPFRDDTSFESYELSNIPFVPADEYLSGNVRQKLHFTEQLAKARPDLSEQLAQNIEALKQAQPKDLDASEISVRLGTTWVNNNYIEQFVLETLQPPAYLADSINVNYAEYTGEWHISASRRIPSDNVLANVTYGTERMHAYQIIEDTLNLKDVRVYDVKMVDGRETRVLNKKETMLAQQKQESIKQAFRDWIFKDPERRHDLVQLYNERFNSTRPREYDGRYIKLSGISPDIIMREHQLNAIARIIYGGNSLLAHEVGAGKTFEIVAAAMELKRLGLAQKSMIAVPNHLTEQWASEFLRLYPSANILVATKKDFEMRNRKKFCAKIATGDYDAVIIGHTQLDKIPLSKERQRRLIIEQIDEITSGIAELENSDAPHFTIKQLEKTRKALVVRLEKLNDDSRKDDVVSFEQLGIDRLFVDEAHSFKNLFLYTKMRNVAGISQTEAQKSSDLFGKCRYLDEETNGKGIIFATGTPVSNSMTEMYTMQRYLQYDALQRSRLSHFDSWASTFGETTTAIELAPEGTGYRARTRFAKFHNLPELMCMFKDVADIKTADTMNLPRPKANFNTMVVKPTEIQTRMVHELSKRAAVVHNGGIASTEDNMLKITSDGRKIGLDQRLINPMLPDDPGSKVNACMNEVHRIWETTQADKLTQLVFCDFSTPNKDGRFNVYDDIKSKLLEKGIPDDEIAFIHDANTEVQKKELFAKVRQGKVRVLFGSTFKMGSGTNVQDRLIHLHDLDCPWRPSDLEQRAGRIVRQGNMNPEVGITRYVTEGTFDAYLYQTIENKQKFISQIMSSKSPVRSCEDVDEAALSYAEIKALCAGNPLIKEKMDLDIDVARLKLLKANHQSQHYKLEDDLLTKYPQDIKRDNEHIAGFKADAVRIRAGTQLNADGFSPMTVHGVVHDDKKQAGTALLQVCTQLKGTTTNVGSYRGLDMLLSFDSFYNKFHLNLKGAMSYGTELGVDAIGNITRLNNAITELPNRLESVQKHLENIHQQIENAKVEREKPFLFETQLAEKSARLALLDAELNMDSSHEAQEEHEASIPETAVAKRLPKPSILESLKHTVGAGKMALPKSKTTEISI
jgi:DNA methylase